MNVPVSNILVVYYFGGNSREGMATAQVLHKCLLKLLSVAVNHCEGTTSFVQTPELMPGFF